MLAILFRTSVLLLACSYASADLVPVLIWETEKNNEVVPSVSHVTTETFSELLQQKIRRSNPQILVFAEETFSPEDFNQHGSTTFKHISHFGTTHQLSYMPTVKNPIKAIKNLHAQETAIISANDLLQNEALPNAKVIIVNLKDAKDVEDRVDMLIRHDKLISNIYEKYQRTERPLLAILTGLQASWILPEQTAHPQTRKVLADEDLTSSYASTDNFLIYIGAKGTFQTDSNGAPEEFILNEVTLTDNVAEVKLSNSKILQLGIREIVGYWYISDIVYDGKNFTLIDAYAPFGWSYHCSELLKSTEGILTLPELQVQYDPRVGAAIAKFGDAYHCVGFTTIPIWSGLFVTFILIAILTVGLTMIMDIKTMDRFDDPKGKTIMINVSE